MQSQTTYLGISKNLLSFRKEFFESKGLKSEHEITSYCIAKKLKQVPMQESCLTSLKNIEYNLRVQQIPNNEVLGALSDRSSRDSSLSRINQEESQQYLDSKAVFKLIGKSFNHQIKMQEPEKVDKTKKISSEWMNQKELIIIQIEHNLINQKKQIKEHFKDLLSDKKFIEITKYQIICHDGKLSLRLVFREDKQAQFMHYNISLNLPKYQKFLGQNIQVFQFRKQLDQDQPSSQVKLCIRNLPLHIKTGLIKHYLSNFKELNVEEAFEYHDLSYYVIHSKTLDQAENVRSHLQKIFAEQNLTDVSIHIQNSQYWSNQKKQKYNSFFLKRKSSINDMLEKNLGPLEPMAIESPKNDFQLNKAQDLIVDDNDQKTEEGELSQQSTLGDNFQDIGQKLDKSRISFVLPQIEQKNFVQIKPIQIFKQEESLIKPQIIQSATFNIQPQSAFQREYKPAILFQNNNKEESSYHQKKNKKHDHKQKQKSKYY